MTHAHDGTNCSRCRARRTHGGAKGRKAPGTAPRPKPWRLSSSAVALLPPAGTEPATLLLPERGDG